MATEIVQAPKSADQAGIAPLPTPTAPLDVLRFQVARREGALRIQREVRDAGLAAMRDLSLPESVRAEAKESLQYAAWEIIRLQGELREYKAELSAATGYATAAARAAQLNERIDGGVKLSAMEWDDLAHAEDMMAGARAALAEAGRLDLIGGGR